MIEGEHKYFDCKPEVDLEDMKKMSPYLVIIIGHIALWCYQHNLPFVITSAKSDAVSVERVSDTHKEARAIDMSIRGWTKEDLDKFEATFELRFRHLAAISKKHGRPNLIEIHEAKDLHGNTQPMHIHLQVRRIEDIKP